MIKFIFFKFVLDKSTLNTYLSHKKYLALLSQCDNGELNFTSLIIMTESNANSFTT